MPLGPHASGATALFCYSPLLDRPTAEQFANEYRVLVEPKLTLPVLAPIEEMIYGRDLFYDTANHLNWSGTCRRMATLAAGLDRHVAPASSVTIDQQIAARDRAIRGLDRIAARSASSGQR